jgi:hypothetical protein
MYTRIQHNTIPHNANQSLSLPALAIDAAPTALIASRALAALNENLANPDGAVHVDECGIQV